MVFTTEGFLEIAVESWPEWGFNPRSLNSVPLYIYIYIYIYINTFLIKRYFPSYVAFSSSIKIEIFDKLQKSSIYKSYLIKKKTLKLLTTGEL